MSKKRKDTIVAHKFKVDKLEQGFGSNFLIFDDNTPALNTAAHRQLLDKMLLAQDHRQIKIQSIDRIAIPEWLPMRFYYTSDQFKKIFYGLFLLKYFILVVAKKKTYPPKKGVWVKTSE